MADIQRQAPAPAELNALLIKLRAQLDEASRLLEAPWSEGEERAWKTRTTKYVQDALGESDMFAQQFVHTTSAIIARTPFGGDPGRIRRHNRDEFLRAHFAPLREVIREVEEQLHSVPPMETVTTTPIGGPLPAEDFSFMAASDLRMIARRDYTELQNVLPLPTVKAKSVLAGSVIEAVLMDALERAGRARAHLDKYQLADLTREAASSSLISATTAKAADATRDYRNYVHPAVELRQGAPLRSEDAAQAVVLMRQVIADLKP